jgi:hypothetical protein
MSNRNVVFTSTPWEAWALDDFVSENFSLPSGSESKPTPFRAPRRRHPEYIEAYRKVRLKAAFIDIAHPHPSTNSVDALIEAGIQLAVAPPSSIPSDPTAPRFLCHDVINYLFQFLPLAHIARAARVSRDWYFAGVTILAPISNLKKCFPRPPKLLRAESPSSREEYTFISTSPFGKQPTAVYSHSNDRNFGFVEECKVSIGPLTVYYKKCATDDHFSFQITNEFGKQLIYAHGAVEPLFCSDPRLPAVLDSLAAKEVLSLKQFALCFPPKLRLPLIRCILAAGEHRPCFF